MSSARHGSQDKQPAEYLLEHLLETIHIQLEHAKKMDAERLKEATDRRQDLLFQLELEIVHAQDRYLIELQQKLQRLTIA